MLNLKQRTNNSVQVSEDAALFLNDDEKLVLKNDAGVIETIATVEGLAAAEPNRKVYKAMITQSGAAAPSATVFENTIGSIVWTRIDVGSYRGTLAGAFVTTNRTQKVFMSFISAVFSVPVFVSIQRGGDDSLNFDVTDSDSTATELRESIYVEIYQYPT